jgi:hypothetical protein
MANPQTTPLHQLGNRITVEMGRSRIAGALRIVRGRAEIFFNRYCLAGFPWFWPARPPGRDAMVDARRIVRCHFGRHHLPVHRALARLLTATAWPPAVLLHLCQIRYDRGSEAVPIKRAFGALWAALRHNILPGEYYAYALWQPDRRANIDNYFYSNEGPRLFKLLNRPMQSDPIGDKLAFHEMCKAHALPTPAVLAAFSPTGQFLTLQTDWPPKRDLFVKPRIGLAGDGTERFRWQSVDFESNRGHRLKSEDLGEYLTTRAQAENRTLLVQPALSNHPELHVDADAALATARLVTGISANGDVTPIFGFIYFARSDRITAQHGYVALINVTDGRLISVPLRDSSWIRHSNHQPSNGSDNLRRLPDWNHHAEHKLPDWSAALQHVKAAHQACSNFAFVGWDIAFTDCGPTLLEGNANWLADEYQSLTGQPLGLTEFANILAVRLKCQ